jgi:hypothetical protein
MSREKQIGLLRGSVSARDACRQHISFDPSSASSR